MVLRLFPTCQRIKMAPNPSPKCVLCRKETVSGNRVYLKSEEDPSVSIRLVLLAVSSRSQEEVDQFLATNTVCCKAVCFTLKKLAKTRKEMEDMKLEIERRIGSFFDSQNAAQACITSVDLSIDLSGPATPSKSLYSPRRTRLTYDTPTRNALSQPIDSTGSPVVYFVNKKPSGPCRVNVVSKSLRSLGRSVGRRSRMSIVNFVLKDKIMRRKVAIQIGKLIRKEMKVTCSVKEQSIFKDKSLSAINNFSWNSMVLDLKRTAPVMSSVLENSIDRGQKRKKVEIAMAVAASVLLHGHSERACLLQRAVSLLLYGCHAPKQLYTRLQKAGLCVSHRSTIRLVDKMGENFDQDVKEWSNFLKVQLSKKYRIAVDGRMSSDNRSPLIPAVSASDSITRNEVVYTEDWSDGDATCSGDEDMSNGDEDVCMITPPSVSSMTTSSSMSFSPEADIDRNQSTVTKLTVKIPTLKIVGDNIDKSIRPREETSDNHLQSLHYFHSYAVLDRCDMSALEDDPSSFDANIADVSCVLPTDDDNATLRRNLTIIVARILRERFSFFKDNVSSISRHILHSHSKEMSQKSVVVPLGVLTKNEVKNEDMKFIMSHLQQYVPVVSNSSSIEDPVSNEEMELFEDRFHYLNSVRR
ncbi:PREDICTED: uncharacterized protein LOC109591334 [Amphimedon queenslandica]|uniref:Uncharacterized protein n=2 Tax=Amphimedon queenslandica TaxID=400682 RepID=A0AAN0JZV2_AMPQE|nr:PREDICTED: uncharacterized protein LOC109591334 [Amphimedon queenslandica]|eukprot:XP_019862645.1 PREDICTED: uncharacterized protein LOC109591334 [Amphimedon queenslandica]